MSTSDTLWAWGTASRSTRPPGSTVPAGRPPSLPTMATLSSARMRTSTGEAVMRRSLRLEAAGLDDLEPLLAFLGLEGGQLVAGHARGLQAQRVQALAGVGLLQDLGDLLLQALHHVLGRAGGGVHRLPAQHVVAGHAGLGDGGHRFKAL